MSHVLSTLVVLATAALPVVAQHPMQKRPSPYKPERPSDPPAVAAPSATPTHVPGVGPMTGRSRTPEGFVQVNVDQNGNNISGDAANEPSIAVDPTNPMRICIGWRQFDSIASNFREAGYAYTTDGGFTWTFPGPIEDGTFRSDPVLDFDADGNFYYNSLAVPGGGSFQTDVFKSTDGGKTWGPAVFAFGGDKQWMTIDRTGGLGGGNIYTAWSAFFGCCDPNTFNRSVDSGSSFSVPSFMTGQPTFGTLDIGPDGTVYVAGIDPNNFASILVSRSSDAQDGGLTPTFQSTAIDFGGTLGFSTTPNPEGLAGQVNVAVDRSNGPHGGNVYVLATVVPPATDPMEVKFTRSTNGGVSFQTPVRVSDDAAGTNAWQWFGTLSVAPNGRIDVVFNDTRNSGQDNLSQLFYTYSTDGGVTWSANRALGPIWDSHVGWPNQNKIGDYYDMVSDYEGAHLACSTTFNGEQDVYYLRIVP